MTHPSRRALVRTHSYRRAFARATAGTIATALAVAGLAGLASTSATAAPTPPPPSSRTANDAREAPPELTTRDRVSLSAREKKALAAPQVQARRNRVTAKDDATGSAVGDEKNWLLYDSVRGYSSTPYVLRAVGDNIEVWVQKDLNYPAGDCRNDGVRNVVTDAQLNSLVSEFDTNIFPKESQVFSVAPDRDGTKQRNIGFGAPLWQLLGGGDPDYYKGDGNKTVTLVSNVRDENYYDPNSPDGRTYIAGFFSPVFNEGFDRNIMSIDSYDWVHRTGTNPPNDGATQTVCGTAQPARPRLYEGTFAHEYQHLLHYYTDNAEGNWLNEGLSDYAQTLVGYVNTRLPYGTIGADNHLTCFQGFYGSADFPYCGAENSLTRWEDQGSASTLSDYGAVYSFVTYLADHFGQGVVSYLHRDSRAQGLVSLQNYLDDNAPGLRTTDVIHDWAAQMALDRLVDGGAKGLTADQKSRFTSAQLNSAIDWSWTGSYDSPGAPANGSDYVLARTSRPVNARTITSMSFTGAKTYAPDPLAWTVNGGALYSGTGPRLDRSAIYDVTVPSGASSLSFSTKYNIEEGWDFAVVQVSTDGGKTYKSLANAHTTSQHASGADTTIVGKLPGLTGVAREFTSESYDLSAYAGQKVLLSFRYLTDGATAGADPSLPAGWWVKDVQVGSAVVTSGSTLAGARSATQVLPTPVADWSLQAVGWKLDGTRVRYADIKLSKNHKASLTKAKARQLFAGADRIGFIVSVDDPAEAATKNAGYRLRVNQTTQPGGSGDTNATLQDPLLAKRLPISHRSKLR